MTITLCMVVKNEAGGIADCLKSAMPIVDDVLIADTGSSDGTQDIVRSITGRSPHAISLDPANCYSLTPARNKLYEQVRTDWIFYLDADERIAPASGGALRSALAHTPATCGGFFGAWQTFLPDDQEFLDYKLFVFRRGLRKRGLAHANVQLDLRSKSLEGHWVEGFLVHHRPDTSLLPAKRALYWERLQRSMLLEAGWLRHNWFAGYMCFVDGNFDEARRFFQPLLESRSTYFPVEGLNARMVLIDMWARECNAPAAKRQLQEALDFLAQVGSDFEVRVNFRLRPWFQAADSLLSAGRIEAIRAYQFAS